MIALAMLLVGWWLTAVSWVLRYPEAAVRWIVTGRPDPEIAAAFALAGALLRHQARR